MRARFQTARLLLLAVATLVIVQAGGGHVRGDTRPNVVVMLTDDQGYGDLGCHGNDIIKTPHLDRLAGESVELTQYLVCPNCSPTRASLLTGRYNYRTGVTEVTRGRHLMRTDEVTIAELLRDAGYRTGIFGKWHLGAQPPMRPTDQGFEQALVHKGGGIGQAAGPPNNGYFDPILEENDVSRQFRGYCDDIFTDAALEFMRANRQQPFFVYLATNLPHFPLEVSDARADPYRKLGLHEHNALTYGMITNIDANVGRVLAELERLGISENTIVVFLSDNGPRTRRTKNDVYPGRYVAGLRGTKTSVYENGIRVPFFVRWPGVLPAGKRVSRMAGHIDLLPTLLDACGVELPRDRKIDGRSLLPLLRGDAVADWSDRRLFFQWHSGPVPFQYVHFAVRTERYKLVQPQDNPHGFVHPPDRAQLLQILRTLELYDVRNDPSEINNLANQKPEVVEQLLADYENWFHDVTSERDFHHPEKIHLGGVADAPIVLSRFEWLGPRTLPLEDYDEQLGHWDVEILESGRYQLTLEFAPAQVAGRVVVRFGSQRWAQPIQAGAKTCTFSNLQLERGPGKLEAFVRQGRLDEGVHFVTVARVESES